MLCLLVVLPSERLKTASTAYCHWLIGCFANRPPRRFMINRVVFPCGPTESSVLQSPAFTKQPGSIVYPVETVETNREVVFSCEAQGSPPPTYRWVSRRGASNPPILRSSVITGWLSWRSKYQHNAHKCLFLRICSSPNSNKKKVMENEVVIKLAADSDSVWTPHAGRQITSLPINCCCPTPYSFSFLIKNKLDDRASLFLFFSFTSNACQNSTFIWERHFRNTAAKEMLVLFSPFATLWPQTSTH